MPNLPETVNVDLLLNRPRQQRILEYKQRCAQAIVFGLPVMLLQWFGPSLGGQQVEQQRWIAILQAVLAGWVAYVGATGMVVEGILRLPRFGFDLLVGAIAAAMYLYSAGSTLGVFFIGRPFYGPLMFHWTVLILALWCGGQWLAMSRTVARE